MAKQSKERHHKEDYYMTLFFERFVVFCYQGQNSIQEAEGKEIVFKIHGLAGAPAIRAKISRAEQLSRGGYQFWLDGRVRLNADTEAVSIYCSMEGPGSICPTLRVEKTLVPQTSIVTEFWPIDAVLAL